MNALPEAVVSREELMLLENIASTIMAAKRVIITAHEKPDGDAIGSALALQHALTALDTPAVVAGLAPVPQRYQFLPGSKAGVTGEAIEPHSEDVLVVLDAGDLSRIDAPLQNKAAYRQIVNIDHHLSNSLFGALNYVDAHASSTGELIYRLCVAAKWPISPEMAICLWAAIVTDTGRFAYDNTSAETLRVASDIRKQGMFSSADVNERLYENCDLKSFKLRERAAHSLELFADNKLAIVSLTLDDFNALGCTPEHAEDIVNIPRSIAGVDAAAFIYAVPNTTKVKMSLRTRPPLDAAALCRTLDGGGHARAAGCSLEAPFAEAKQTFLTAMLTRLGTHGSIVHESGASYGIVDCEADTRSD